MSPDYLRVRQDKQSRAPSSAGIEAGQDWEFSIGLMLGMGVPLSIGSIVSELRAIVKICCRGPYDPAGITVGLAIYISDSCTPSRRLIKQDPLRKNDIGASIYLTKVDWDRPDAEFRVVLWSYVREAAASCMNRLLQSNPEFDANRLKSDLCSAKLEFLVR